MRKKRRPGYAWKQQTLLQQSPKKNPDRKNRRERKKSRRTNGGHAAAALPTRNPRPGRGRWPMNRRGRGTGARPAPGRAIRKRGNGAENRHKTRREQSNVGRAAVRTVQQHEWMGRIRPISRAVPTGKRTKIAMTAYVAHMRGRKDFYERRASICIAVRASAYTQGGRQTFRLLFPRDDYVPANRLVDPVRKFQPRAAVLHGKAGVRKECGDLCARQNEYVP